MELNTIYSFISDICSGMPELLLCKVCRNNLFIFLLPVSILLWEYTPVCWFITRKWILGSFLIFIFYEEFFSKHCLINLFIFFKKKDKSFHSFQIKNSRVELLDPTEKYLLKSCKKWPNTFWKCVHHFIFLLAIWDLSLTDAFKCIHVFMYMFAIHSYLFVKSML